MSDQLFSRSTEAGTDSYLTDRLGSVLALANGSGEVKTDYTYEPFGASSSSGAPTTTHSSSPGAKNDGTGLQYNRARYYSPADGRFISQDPAGFGGSGSNLYWYANGDPLGFIDPSGKDGLEIGPISIGNPFLPVEELGHEIGSWVSDGEGVVSEAGSPSIRWIGETGENVWDEISERAECLYHAIRHPEEEQECLHIPEELVQRALQDRRLERQRPSRDSRKSSL